MPPRSSSGASRRRLSSVKVDFTGVETRKKVDEGEYQVTVQEVSEQDGAQAPYLKWVFEIEEGSESDGGKLYLNTSLSEQSLWNLKALLEALGIAVEEDEMSLDLEGLVGEKCMVSVELELYEGKKRPRIVDYWAVEKQSTAKPAASDKGKPTGKPAAGKKGKAAAEKDPLTQDQISDMDEGELEDIVKDYTFEVDLSKFKTLRKKQAAVIDAAEKAEMLEE